MRLAESLQEARIAELEARVAELHRRVERLESGRQIEDSEVFHADARTFSQELRREAETAEYWISAKLIPRMGAVLIILAIAVVAFLEASKSSGATRALLLAGEALLCFAFIAVGEWKRDELEGFGKTLAAIGSCGLYLTVAGGHFAYRAMSEAEMAWVFAWLTLLNHGYAIWRNTRLFFMIGALGGTAAMIYPLAKNDYATALAVYTVVTLAGAAACAARKWLQLAIVGWLFGLVVLVPVIDSSQSRASVLAAMYLGSLSCIGASAWAYGRRRIDTLALGPPIALLATALAGLWVVPGAAGIGHLAVLASLAALVALKLPKDDPAQPSLLIGAAAVLFVLGPICFEPWTGTATFSVLAWAAYAVGRFAIRRLAAVFSVAAALLTGASYVRAVAFGPASEHVLLVLVALALPASWLALRRAKWDWVNFAAGSAWALLVRWAIVAGLPPVPENPYSVLTLALVGYSLLLLALGFRLHCATLRMWSFAAMLATVLQILSLGGSVPAGFRLTALLAVGIMMLAGGYRYIRDRKLPAP